MTYVLEPVSAQLSRALSEQIDRAADDLLATGLAKVRRVEIVLYLADDTTRGIIRSYPQLGNDRSGR